MIRPVEPQDAASLHEIFTTSLGYSCTPEVIGERIDELRGDPRFVSLVCEDENSSVQGFIHAMRYDTLHSLGGWDVISLAVAPSEQGKGIGRQLLEACEQEILSRGGTYVRLNSRVERTEAHGFYEHVGYTCDKLQKRFIRRL